MRGEYMEWDCTGCGETIQIEGAWLNDGLPVLCEECESEAAQEAGEKNDIHNEMMQE